MAKVRDGTYEFDLSGRLVKAFTTPGVSKSDIHRLRHVAQAAQAGSLPADQIAAEIGFLPEPLRALWAAIEKNAGTLNLIVALIALYLAATSGKSTETATTRQLAASEQLLDQARRQTEITQQMVDGLHMQEAERVQPRMDNAPTSGMPVLGPKKVLNRKERRAQARRDAKRK